MIDTILLNAIGESPKGTITLIHDYDIDNVNYMNGCQGKAKYLVENNSQNNTVKTTVFKYQDVAFPNCMTSWEVL